MIVALLAVVVVGALLLIRNVGSEAASDVAVLSQLRHAGSDLSKPHEMEFFMYFPNEASAQRVAVSLRQKGFRADVRHSANRKPEWLVLAGRSMVPDASELVRLRAELSQLSSTEQGIYDGWGAPVVK
jgi:hypothetical protein